MKFRLENRGGVSVSTFKEFSSNRGIIDLTRNFLKNSSIQGIFKDISVFSHLNHFSKTF